MDTSDSDRPNYCPSCGEEKQNGVGDDWKPTTHFVQSNYTVNACSAFVYKGEIFIHSHKPTGDNRYSYLCERCKQTVRKRYADAEIRLLSTAELLEDKPLCLVYGCEKYATYQLNMDEHFVECICPVSNMKVT